MQGAFTLPGQGAFSPEDIYASDICRHLSIAGASSSEDVIASLRSMDLGDNFWMYSFKVVPCAKTFSHKWTLCPCAHAGETARRRDPRLHPYRAVLCPLVKAKKTCPLGDNCLWSHNVFEHWLHPSRYKTRLCSFGRACNRPICFFAHSAEELRSQPSMEESKDVDEREYLMQLMLAQEAGMLPAQAVHFQQQPSRGPAYDKMLSMQGGSGGPHGLRHLPPPPQQQQQQQRHYQQNMSHHHAHQRHSHQHQLQQQQQAATLLMNLQESIANMGAGTSGGGWPSAGRISDPGNHATHHQMLHGLAAGDAPVTPSVNRTRASDSGQLLGMALQKHMAEMGPLASVAGGGRVSPIPSSAPSGSPRELLQQSSSNSPTVTVPGNDRAAMAIHYLSRNSSGALGFNAQGGPPVPSGGSFVDEAYLPGSNRESPSGARSFAPPPPPPPPPPPRRCSSGAAIPYLATSPSSPAALGRFCDEAAGSSQGGSGSGGGGPADAAYVSQLVAQLQEQGVVQSKEQLVQSLSQILAQLLVHK